MASNNLEDAGHSVTPEQDVAYQNETTDSTSEINLKQSLPVRADHVYEKTVDLELKVNLKPISVVLADKIDEDTVVSTSENSLELSSPVLADNDEEKTVPLTSEINSELISAVLADHVEEGTVGPTLENNSEITSPVQVDHVDKEIINSTLDVNSMLVSSVLADHVEGEIVFPTLKIDLEMSLPVQADHVDEGAASPTLESNSESSSPVRNDQIDEESGSTSSDTEVTALGDLRPGSGDSSETEHSNDEIFDNKNEEHQLAESTHPGHPWESDSEEEDSDDECDAGQHDSNKNGEAMSFEQTRVNYKTAFGTIALFKDPPQGLNKSPALDVDGLPHTSVTAPLEPIAEPESFHNEFYEVKRSEVAGFGAFALCKLVKGQTILIEKSLFHADNYSLRDEINKLAPDLRRAFERMPSHGVKGDAGRHETRAAIFKTNSFVVNRWDCGVFVTASKFNNACGSKKNVAYVYDDRHDCMVFTVEKDIEAGDELFITYGKDPKTLYKQYGFVCRCGGCASLTEAQIEKIKNPGW